MRTQPFSASSRLLFVQIPGQPTVSNSPELVAAQGPDDDESSAVQTYENRLARKLVRAPIGFTTVPAPDVDDVRLLKVPLRLQNGLAVTIGAGEALRDVVRAQDSVARAFVLAGILALAAVLIASYFVGARVRRRCGGWRAWRPRWTEETCTRGSSIARARRSRSGS